MSETQPSLDMQLLVTLSVAQWRNVLEQLSNGPFRTMATLIGEIEKQCNEQLKHAQRGNGAMVEERPNA